MNMILRLFENIIGRCFSLGMGMKVNRIFGETFNKAKGLSLERNRGTEKQL